MNKILFILHLMQLVYCDYPRIPNTKIRGPSIMPPRPPPLPPYLKKWQNLHRPQQLRPRPISFHLPSTFYKLPVGVVASVSRPTAVVAPIQIPNTNNLKTPFKTSSLHSNHSNKFFVYKPVKVPSEKPFYSSPTLASSNHQHYNQHPLFSQDYEFHLQNNAIPNNVNLIKQIGETGPIHTIPAPNLSLADKPIVVEEVRPASFIKVHKGNTNNNYQRPFYNHPHHHQQQHTHHQYQVTELPEPKPLIKHLDNHNQQFYHIQNFDTLPLSAVLDQAATSGQKPEFIFTDPDGAILHHNTGHHIDTKEFYNLLSQQQQQQQQQKPVIDAFNFPNVVYNHHQQQEISAASSPTHQVLFQPEHSFLQQIQAVANYDNIQPQKTISRRDYMTENESSNNVQSALAQTQYVQEYFQTNKKLDDDNIIEPDAKPSNKFLVASDTNNDDDDDDDKDSDHSLFATLPNRKAAETLATLQEAGRINSSLMQLSTNSTN